ncbi:MAG: hypothetical protein NT157_04290, partial [Candidatus Micrarchaeota archaeon]|nr:hypothetical protein [Candidatus Micrarchaeota archaeon]
IAIECLCALFNPLAFVYWLLWGSTNWQAELTGEERLGALTRLLIFFCLGFMACYSGCFL